MTKNALTDIIIGIVDGQSTLTQLYRLTHTQQAPTRRHAGRPCMQPMYGGGEAQVVQRGL